MQVIVYTEFTTSAPVSSRSVFVRTPLPPSPNPCVDDWLSSLVWRRSDNHPIKKTKKKKSQIREKSGSPSPFHNLLPISTPTVVLDNNIAIDG